MSASTVDTLQQLLALLCRSFPAYLVYAKPWTRFGEPSPQEHLTQIATDQQALADRVAEAILEHGGVPRPTDFPMEFTDLHDLAAAYVLQLAVEYQKQDIEAIEGCVERLRMAPAARALAEEALGLAKGHLQVLRSLTNPGNLAAQVS